MYRIGVDIRSTNTHIVLLDVTAFDPPGRGAQAYYEPPTTAHVTSGIATAIATILIRSSLPKTFVHTTDIAIR